MSDESLTNNPDQNEETPNGVKKRNCRLIQSYGLSDGRQRSATRPTSKKLKEVTD